ncbi:podocalyxin-like protein 2 [Marmota marmota marmota]|uniref:podocalyxin-like protein 2 n=1 Tax=Marmota marmota marmota TaxID=9994 RepID=UPI0020939057|nr:podocalyxin-like protein 2 [Marmota marmota marmota]
MKMASWNPQAALGYSEMSWKSPASGIFLVTGVSLGSRAAGTDEPGPEGLTSTSLLDLLLPTGLEPLDGEEPSESMGLGAGLGAPGSGFPSDESEESRILQPPQYFWEEEELNASSLDLGPTAALGHHTLTVTITKSDGQIPEEEEEELLPVTGPQAKATTQAPDSPPRGSSSQAPGATRPRQEDSGDQASSGVDVESSADPSLSPPSVTPSTVTLGDQDLPSQEDTATMLSAAGLGVEFKVPQGAREEATVGAPDLAGRPGDLPPLAPSPATRAPGEGHLDPRTSASFPPAPRDTEPTPSPATLGPDTLSQQPQEGPVAGAPSRTPWDSTQVICKDWSNLAGKNYIILNMTENVDCEVFRRHRGLQLVALVEEVLPRHRSGRHGDWHISLSKPSEKEQHLLMALVGEQGVVPTQDVLSMLGDIRRSLEEVRVQGLGPPSCSRLSLKLWGQLASLRDPTARGSRKPKQTGVWPG